MQPEVQARYSARAKVIKALAHPTRLFMVDELSRRGKRCVCDLTDMVGADISTVSRHLAILKNAGIIGDERRGTQIFYEAKIVGIGNLLKCFETFFQKATQTQLQTLRN
jgi:ArsR family transcriptional regulator